MKLNQRKYADLLAEALPSAITNDEELERFTLEELSRNVCL
jgi:hypothetical protein